MSAIVNEINVWQLNVPVIDIAGGGDFDVWQFDTPAVTQDESNPNTQPRRRVAEY